MKKAFLFITLIITIVAIGAYIFIFSRGPETEENIELNGGVIEKDQPQSSLLEWLKGSNGVLCSVMTAGEQITVRTRDNKVRVDGIPYATPSGEEESLELGSMVNDGDMVYIWSGLEGMKYSIKDMEDAAQSTSTPQEDFNWEDYDWEDMVADWEKEELDYNCEETRISDDIFTPPTNIKFVDWGETMQKIEQMQEDIEAGLEEGETMNMEDIEEYLEDMGFDEMMQEEEPPVLE